MDVELGFMPLIRDRVNAARKLDEAMNRVNRSKVAESWFVRQAEELGIDVDDEMVPSKKRRRNFDDADDVQAADDLKHRREQQLLKNALKQLLGE